MLSFKIVSKSLHAIFAAKEYNASYLVEFYFKIPLL
jgi:hypothetical protein